MKAAVIAVLFFVSVSARADEWPTSDKVLLGSALGLLVIDWGQSRDIARRMEWNKPECADGDFRAAPAIAGTSYCSQQPRYREYNPLLPTHPTEQQVNRYFLLMTAGTTALAFALPHKYRAVFLGGVVVLESVVVIRNHQVGLRVSF